MRYGPIKYPFDREMVAPSCCLEYQPTIYFWLILFVVVFPSIYVCGRVIGCVVSILFRVMLGLCRFFLWDDEDYEEQTDKELEEQDKLRDEKESAREEERQRRREERERQRAVRRRQHAAAVDVRSEALRKLLANCSPVVNGKQEQSQEMKQQPSDNSDSLISECEDENSQATSPLPSVSDPVPLQETQNLHQRHHHRHV